MVTETMFLRDVERLYSVFEKRNQRYVGKNYQALIFEGEVSYKNFVKIHNFKSQIPLPLPSCDCIFQELSDALNKKCLKGKLLAIGELSGFLLPMASAVLHFSTPEKYPIIDKNVIKGMRKLGWKTRAVMEITGGTVEFYKYYISKIQSLTDKGNIRDIAKKFKITPTRLIEAALYSMGKNW